MMKVRIGRLLYKTLGHIFPGGALVGVSGLLPAG